MSRNYDRDHTSTSAVQQEEFSRELQSVTHGALIAALVLLFLCLATSGVTNGILAILAGMLLVIAGITYFWRYRRDTAVDMPYYYLYAALICWIVAVLLMAVGVTMF